MRRREFIAGLGSAAAWPLAARAQQGDRVRRVAVLMNLAADNAESQTRYAAFLQELGKLGWTVGHNLRIDIRWGSGDNESYRKYAAELNALAPDVILATNSPIVGIVQQTNRALPIVFVQVSDPVGSGLVGSLARPGGNVTGFANGEFGTTAKWLELLKQVAPVVVRVAVLRDSTNPAEIGQFAALQAVAPLLGMNLNPLDVHDVCKPVHLGLQTASTLLGRNLRLREFNALGIVAAHRQTLSLRAAARVSLHPAAFCSLRIRHIRMRFTRSDQVDWWPNRSRGRLFVGALCVLPLWYACLLPSPTVEVVLLTPFKFRSPDIA